MFCLSTILLAAYVVVAVRLSDRLNYWALGVVLASTLAGSAAGAALGALFRAVVNVVIPLTSKRTPPAN